MLIGAECAHTDVLAFGGFPAAIEEHDCGAREVHKALDSSQPCLPCDRNSTSNALVHSFLLGAALVQSPVIIPGPFVPREIPVASSASKRGPPILIAV